MAYIPDQQINTGQFLATTAIFDVARLYEVDVTSPEFKELLVRLYQQVNNLALSTNNKKSGYYLEEEFITSAIYFNPTSVPINDPLQLRPEFRKTFNIGPVPPGALAPFPHNLPITNTWQFTHIYGVASDNIGFNYYPMPFASAGATIELRVTLTDIIIVNNTAINFTSCIVTLEYLKF